MASEKISQLTNGGVLQANDAIPIARAGSNYKILGNQIGSVKSVSITTANGFAGSVANSTTTPNITLSTTITGIIKGNGTEISAATPGTDYFAPGENLNLGDYNLLASGLISNIDNFPIILPVENTGSYAVKSGDKLLFKNSFQYDSGTSGRCNSSFDFFTPTNTTGSSVFLFAKTLAENVVGSLGYTINSDNSGRFVLDLADSLGSRSNFIEANYSADNFAISLGVAGENNFLSIPCKTIFSNVDIISGLNSGDYFNIGAVDEGLVVKNFITLTSGPTPSLQISKPSGTNANMDGVVIGATTPANGNFDTITALNALAVEYGGTGQDSYENGQVLVGNNAGGLTRTTLTAGSNIAITNGDGSIEISCTTPATLPFTTVTATSQAIAVNNGYIARSASSVDFTLPTTASIGDIFEILYRSPNAGRLLQNAGQSIIAGDQQTTPGTDGRIDGINNGEVLIIRCTDTNTEFMVISPVGNFNVV